MRSFFAVILRRFVVILPFFVLAACSSVSGFKVPVLSAGGAQGSASVSNKVLAPMGNGILGNLAAQLAPSDRRAAIEAEYKALEYAPKGTAISWKGRSGTASGEVVAAQPYQVGSQNCRQYSHNVIIDGAPQTMRGTACRNEDGSWSPLT
ncbi:hypothetical protein [Pseudochrobactrum sp. HB0163]|uniref:hypothetical protein n=1 Tax=Pseudochrobactrum sp. HB0163 TaxID=3450708 RepID=UPI003F6E331E